MRSILHCPCIKKSLIVRTKKKHVRECNTTETLHIIPDAQEPQQQVRGRPKYASYQNFKGRKSSSLMNLCGKEHHSELEPYIYPLNIYSFFCVLCKVDKFLCFFTRILITVLGHSVKHVHSSFAWWQVAEYTDIKGGRYFNWTLKHLHPRWQHSF